MLTKTPIEFEQMRTKPSFRLILFISVLLAASLACRFAADFFEGGPGPDNVEAPAPLVPPVEQRPKPDPAEQVPATAERPCPAVMDRIVEVATAFYEEGTSDENSEDPEEQYLITYSVSGNQISNPIYYEDISGDLAVYVEDQTSHQEIWDYFVTLIPVEDRTSLAEYSIITDGVGNLLASVVQTPYDPALWDLEVDIRDSGDTLNLTYTLIHEYAHLLTLGPDQVTPSEAVFNNPDDEDIYLDEVSACLGYFPGEGCSHPNSYINAFYNMFWTDIYEEWQGINLIEDDDAYYAALDDFYNKYKDRFVTDYAATNPEEDIAEAFTFFILSPHPDSDTMAENKIRFFYDYPELVELRDEITSGLCRLNR